MLKNSVEGFRWMREPLGHTIIHTRMCSVVHKEALVKMLRVLSMDREHETVLVVG